MSLLCWQLVHPSLGHLSGPGWCKYILRLESSQTQRCFRTLKSLLGVLRLPGLVVHPARWRKAKSTWRMNIAELPRGCIYMNKVRTPLKIHTVLFTGWVICWGLTSVILQLTGECLPLALGSFIIGSSKEMSLQLFDKEPSGTYQQYARKKSPRLCL